MPKLTDYARQGFRRRRLFQETELPEWWNIAVWAGVGGIILMLLVSAVFDHGDSSGTATSASQAPRYQVQTLDPRGLTASPSPGEGTPTPSGSPSQVLPTGAAAANFTATAATRVPMTDGGATVVPAGALNVAAASARAIVTGNWKAIPIIGTARPSPAKAMPRGSAVQGITVADPTKTGNSQYRFSATITHASGARPDVVDLLVEPDGRGYAVRAG
ncbi:hypothetical protein [Actinomadura mexicana]|uniref:Uncharacterized protein n=1 Tax=Actinomadura mexicana TaxID=134959 RepID=A0A238WXS2_9ACTN|nr:hypothetical protein [Actinomadura mexicana]SNR51004.1 hypothetical protein SAMN06265355_103411 [Actinomadura mexicana]